MNSLSLVSIAEILDGRYFFIPAYQRGYRWSEAQMTDLLDDLYEFAIRDKKRDGKYIGEFYCLQPVIVRRIINEDQLDAIRVITRWGDSMNAENTWEVVDGQQRLTSLYIIFRALIENEIASAKTMRLDGLELYHMYYESRPESKYFLENISSETTNNGNIDFTFISNAFLTVEKWLKSHGPMLAKRYNKRSRPRDILSTLYSLLTTEKEAYCEETGSAQFIWYELASDSKKNPIDEFVSINNGKIRLTDAELIKGLILQKRNFQGDKTAEQMKIALQWENIENTLHRNDFWNFLSTTSDADNRIELVFRLRYFQERTESLTDGDLFRFYFNDLLAFPPGADRENAVKQEWKNIVEIFDTLQEWYEDPILYNVIGYLIHSGLKLQQIMTIYNEIPADAPKDLFLEELYKQIQERLPSREEVEKKEIKCSYKSNVTGVRRLLLFLNIYQLNKQIVELRKNNPTVMTPAYKFPFDLYVSQDWDVEHIDSATRNDLRDIEEKREYLDQSVKALGMQEDPEIKSWLEEGTDNAFEAIWNKVLQRSSNSGDEEKKDTIGNLTLLDASTNREYHNRIFALKRAHINEVITAGRFIPVCTQMVFNKSFENQGVNLRDWSDEDKNLYQEFILKELASFYKINESCNKTNLFIGNE